MFKVQIPQKSTSVQSVWTLLPTAESEMSVLLFSELRDVRTGYSLRGLRDDVFRGIQFHLLLPLWAIGTLHWQRAAILTRYKDPPPTLAYLLVYIHNSATTFYVCAVYFSLVFFSGLG